MPFKIRIVSTVLLITGALQLMAFLLHAYAVVLGQTDSVVRNLPLLLSSGWLLLEIAVRFVSALGISQGRSWARWLYLCWMPFSLSLNTYLNGTSKILYCGYLIYFIFLYLLTRRDTREFFRTSQLQCNIPEFWRRKRFKFSIGFAYISGIAILFTAAIIQSPLRHANTILGTGGLAHLPESSQDVKSDEWHGFFGTGESYVKFHASAEDIESFLKNSPGLKNSNIVRLSSKHRYLPANLRQNPAAQDSGLQEDEFFSVHPSQILGTPTWYWPELRIAGRKYSIESPYSSDLGNVVIDDEKLVVWVRLIWG
jgi:hypothetical protein